MEVEQDGQHGLVIAVAYAFIEQEAGVPHHWLQRVLPHDVVELVSVQVLEDQLVPELAEVADSGAFKVSVAGPVLHSVAPTGQVQTAAAAVQTDGGAAVLIWHDGGGEHL